MWRKIGSLHPLPGTSLAWFRLGRRSAARPYLGTADEWVNPIQYVRRGNGFELRSAGPDGTMGTSDDVVVNDSSGRQ